MKKVLMLLLLGVASSSLMAYSDLDMDGVADSVDQCPNTPLTDLVDIKGCSIKKLQVKQSASHYDVIVGANYSGSNYVSTPSTSTYSGSLQVDYYYKDFSLQASTSYYETDSDDYSDNGLNDSFVGMAYNLHPLKALTVRLGVGAILPTYDTSLNNNNTDYTASANVSYALGKVNVFAGYIYTRINDDDVTVTLSDGSQYSYIYNDTNAYSIGAGYYITNKFYLSGAYNSTESIYEGVENADTVSAYAYYSIDAHWFMNGSYAYGLSDSASDNALSIKLGYYF
jgi:predicted porin